MPHTGTCKNADIPEFSGYKRKCNTVCKLCLCCGCASLAKRPRYSISSTGTVEEFVPGSQETADNAGVTHSQETVIMSFSQEIANSEEFVPESQEIANDDGDEFVPESQEIAGDDDEFVPGSQEIAGDDEFVPGSQEIAGDEILPEKEYIPCTIDEDEFVPSTQEAAEINYAPAGSTNLTELNQQLSELYNRMPPNFAYREVLHRVHISANTIAVDRLILLYNKYRLHYSELDKYNGYYPHSSVFSMCDNILVGYIFDDHQISNMRLEIIQMLYYTSHHEVLLANL